MRAWSFLKSASPDLDYRVVAAPEFVCNANQEIRQHFAKAIPDTYVPFDEVLRCQWQPPTVEINGGKPFDIVYRMVQATRQHLGEESDAPLHDNVGREIRIIEGLVFEQPVKEVTHHHLDEAHNAILPHFREFFPQKKWVPMSVSAIDVEIELDGERQPLPPFLSQKAQEKETVHPRPTYAKAPYVAFQSSPKQIANIIDLNNTIGKDNIVSLHYSYDGEYVAVRTEGQDIIVIKTKNGSALHVLKSGSRKLGTGSACLFAFSPEQELPETTRFVVAFNHTHDGHAVMVCDIDGSGIQKRFCEYISADRDPIKHITFDVRPSMWPALRSDELLIAIDARANVYGWESVFWQKIEGMMSPIAEKKYKQKPVSFLLETPAAACLLPESAGRLWITGDEHGMLRIYRDGLQSQLPSSRALHRSSITLLDIARDGKYAASADKEEVFVWSLRTGQVQLHISIKESPIVSQRLCTRRSGGPSFNNTHVLLLAHCGGEVSAHTVETNMHSKILTLDAPIQAMTATPYGRCLAVALEDGRLLIFEDPLDSWGL